MNIDPNAIYATVILSVILVPLGSLLKREHWNNAVKFGVAGFSSLVLAALQTAVVYKTFTWGEFSVHLALAIATAQTIFHTYFKNSGFDNYLEAIGSAEPAVETAVSKAVPDAGKVIENIETGVLSAPVTDPLPLPTGAVATSTTIDAGVVVTPDTKSAP